MNLTFEAFSNVLPPSAPNSIHMFEGFGAFGAPNADMFDRLGAGGTKNVYMLERFSAFGPPNTHMFDCPAAPNTHISNRFGTPKHKLCWPFGHQQYTYLGQEGAVNRQRQSN